VVVNLGERVVAVGGALGQLDLPPRRGERAIELATFT
jgi:hypothetical protein